MLQRIGEMIEKKESFSFETTLYWHLYINDLLKAQDAGFSIVLFFVFLDSFVLAK
jgi:predicted ABC-type ATPase